MLSPKKLCCLLAACGYFANCSADEDSLSSVYFSLGKNNQHTSDVQLGTNLDVFNHLQFNAALYTARNTETSDTTRQTSFGFGSNPYKLFSISLNKDRTVQSSKVNSALLALLNKPGNNEASLISNKTSLPMALSFDTWQLRISPSINYITVALPTFASVNTNNKGLEIGFNYYGWDDYYFSASVLRTRLADVVTTRSNTPQPLLARLILTSIAKSTAASIIDRNFSISFGRYFSWGYLDYNYQKSQTIEILQQHVISQSHTITANYQLSSSYQSDISYAYQSSSNSIITQSINLGINYLW